MNKHEKEVLRLHKVIDRLAKTTYAFPFAMKPGNKHFFDAGMTLRDYFAGQALTGLLAHYDSQDCGTMAQFAYSFAEEMITEKHKRYWDKEEK